MSYTYSAVPPSVTDMKYCLLVGIFNSTRKLKAAAKLLSKTGGDERFVVP